MPFPAVMKDEFNVQEIITVFAEAEALQLLDEKRVSLPTSPQVQDLLSLSEIIEKEKRVTRLQLLEAGAKHGINPRYLARIIDNRFYSEQDQWNDIRKHHCSIPLASWAEKYRRELEAALQEAYPLDHFSSEVKNADTYAYIKKISFYRGIPRTNRFLKRIAQEGKLIGLMGENPR